MRKLLATAILLTLGATTLGQVPPIPPYGYSEKFRHFYAPTTVTVTFSVQTSVNVWDICTEINSHTPGPSWHELVATLKNVNENLNAAAGTWLRKTYAGGTILAQGFIYRPLPSESNQNWVYPERERTVRWYEPQGSGSAD